MPFDVCDVRRAIGLDGVPDVQVQGGFIIGFDNDPESIFDMMIRFIQQSGIVIAMVGLLNAPRGTKLFERLKRENRIKSDSSGNNTDFSMNFKPKMQYEKLLSGYRKVVSTVYSPKNYYARVTEYLRKAGDAKNYKRDKISAGSVLAFLKSIFRLGIAGKERSYFWKLIFHTIMTCPTQLPKGVTFAIYGYHFRRIFNI
jgi:radical SAM superfamily enzyme YgiQ (UPF0313 family)